MSSEGYDCLQGYTLTTYENLVNKLGNPILQNAWNDNGIDILWIIRNLNEDVYCRVYNDNEDVTPLTESKSIYAWHIGGTSRKSLVDFERIVGISTILDNNSNP